MGTKDPLIRLGSLFDTPAEDPAVEFDPLNQDNLTKFVVSELMTRGPFAMPPETQFNGAGVYALFYTGTHPLYAPIRSPAADWPIYVGKAVPAGGRKGKVEDKKKAVARELHGRLREHARSLDEAEDLDLHDFVCRFLVVTRLWIVMAERFLIEHYQPVWNVGIDGFGIHVPGKRREAQHRSRWDTLHPGRSWASRQAVHHVPERVAEEVRNYLTTRRPGQPLPPLPEETVNEAVEEDEDD